MGFTYNYFFLLSILSDSLVFRNKEKTRGKTNNKETKKKKKKMKNRKKCFVSGKEKNKKRQKGSPTRRAAKNKNTLTTFQ